MPDPLEGAAPRIYVYRGPADRGRRRAFGPLDRPARTPFLGAGRGRTLAGARRGWQRMRTPWRGPQAPAGRPPGGLRGAGGRAAAGRRTARRGGGGRAVPEGHHEVAAAGSAHSVAQHESGRILEAPCGGGRGLRAVGWAERRQDGRGSGHGGTAGGQMRAGTPPRPAPHPPQWRCTLSGPPRGSAPCGSTPCGMGTSHKGAQRALRSETGTAASGGHCLAGLLRAAQKQRL